ncbi:thioredoxin-like protein [Lasiosphaeria miniovina]|uniref:Glutathione S-transferase kappa 1 n=1 Tax=Lasiosphaeria miniovina TaxID=1954250 RepID=A0AA40A4G7_9PEZI|nr:thioredoxin-like protein [Lasiosphaeria miniovina]KAK0709109.1 thioredoxin-like protein [Lasiosphaeria miniovina]
MGGRIECYLDITSMYSYLGFLELLKNREALASHNVEIEYHPVLLGAINAESGNGGDAGNKPPWMLPAKATYLVYDMQRSIARFPGLVLQAPEDLMAVSMTVAPLRALHFIKRKYPRKTFETSLHYLFHCFWTPPNANLCPPENLATALSEVPADFGSIPARASSTAAPLFSADEVQAIVAATSSQEVKEQLKAATKEALDRGAFGNPWLWVTNNRTGKAEPFFGSDRFHFVYKFLDLPFQDVTLLSSSLEQVSTGDKPKL